MRVYSITADTLSEERESARALLRSHRLAPLFCAIDPGVYGFSRSGLDLLEGLEV